MTNYTNDGTCHETSGFLFSHRCDRIAMKECVRCAKPVCQDHGHSVVDGTVCTTCLKKEVQTQSPTNPVGLPGAQPGMVAPGMVQPGSVSPGTVPPGASRPGVAMNPNAQPTNYRSRPYYDDPYFYGPHYYGYGYGPGIHIGYYGGHSSYSSRSDHSSGSASAHDPQDFTEGDAGSLRKEGDDNFETDMGES